MGTQEIDKACGSEIAGAPPSGLELAPAHAMFWIDANGHIEDANTRAEILTGYLRTELVGLPITHVMSNVADSTSPPQGGRLQPIAASVRHRTGHPIQASVLLHAHDRGMLVACVCPDDTASEFRSLATARIAHDLKSPLATIALEMCLLDERLASTVYADLCRVAARVTHNVEYLDRLVHDLLDSCALDVGQFAVQREAVELRALLQNVIDRVLATPDRGRVALEAARPVTLAVDGLRIERVVANLLHNALKYAPRSSCIVVRLEVAGGCVRVFVIDDGPGLGPEETAYVFDKYRRASQSHNCAGSGLGLYVSKQIVEAHGGRIGVDSTPGVGSRFFFELPT